MCIRDRYSICIRRETRWIVAVSIQILLDQKLFEYRYGCTICPVFCFCPDSLAIHSLVVNISLSLDPLGAITAFVHTQMLLGHAHTST